MKVISTIILCLSAFVSTAQQEYLRDYVEIEYVGDQTGFWHGIVLHDEANKISVLEKAYNPDRKRYTYINTESYQSIVKYVESFGKYDTGQIDYRKVRPYKISVCKKGKQAEYFIYSGEKIDLYFKNILDVLRKNKCDKATVSCLEAVFKNHY